MTTPAMDQRSPQRRASDEQIAAELRSFFDQFYQARTLTGLHALDLRKSEELVAGSYVEYTMPLLRESQAEAESGALKELRYADISVRLEKWDRAATIHGGLATVAVTRSVFATRSTGAEPPGPRRSNFVSTVISTFSPPDRRTQGRPFSSTGWSLTSSVRT